MTWILNHWQAISFFLFLIGCGFWMLAYNEILHGADLKGLEEDIQALNEEMDSAER